MRFHRDEGKLVANKRDDSSVITGTPGLRSTHRCFCTGWTRYPLVASRNGWIFSRGDGCTGPRRGGVSASLPCTNCVEQPE
jgi:hypothetical protein